MQEEGVINEVEKALLISQELRVVKGKLTKPFDEERNNFPVN